jgi:hypothetical protein
MEQTRILRDGSEAVASTIYLRRPTDTAVKKHAKKLSIKRKKKVSKSRVIVETVEDKFP